MKNKTFCWAIILVFALAGPLSAAPDHYYGDSSVYAGSTATVTPNIMFLFDISDNMTEVGSAVEFLPDGTYINDYEALVDGDGDNYVSAYVEDRVYVQNNTGTANDARMTIVNGNDGYYVSCDSAREALRDNGIWMGSLSKGECNDKAANTYYVGDMASLMFELSQVPQTWCRTGIKFKLVRGG